MDCITALSNAGICYTDIDTTRAGKWQRVPTEDKPRKRNGAVMIFNTRPLRFFYRNFATGVEGYWSEYGGFAKPADLEGMRAAKLAEKRRRATNQAEASQRAQVSWRRAIAAPEDHPYLVSKHVQPHGIRMLGKALLIPMLDVNGLLWSYQSIFPDGRKRYLRGGKKEGCYYPIGGPVVDVLLLVEGFSTGATLRECLDVPVAVCFDAPNLVPAACHLRAKFPDAHFVIAADNDVLTEGNPGIAYARKAAAQVNGCVVYPEFGQIALKEKLTDWNDMRCRYTTAMVTQLLAEVL